MVLGVISVLMFLGLVAVFLQPCLIEAIIFHLMHYAALKIRLVYFYCHSPITKHNLQRKLLSNFVDFMHETI